MTAAVYRSGTPSLSLPQTQNTAPVLEFNCLYTHDIRRKQKRWQDGFLRFHTFNKRVMVYDVPRNFIGDTHWKEDEALQVGDEVTLEKDGVIVQVAESVGRTETDLTELRNSKRKNSSAVGSSSPARPAQTPARLSNGNASRPTAQLKHRSLNALLGASKGPIGKAALPAKSPFEQRHAQSENEEWENGGPPKRRRTEQPAAWNVTRTTKANTSAARVETPLWARTVDSGKQRKAAPLQAGQQRLGSKEITDLSEDVDESTKFLLGFSSDALLPPSPPREQARLRMQPPVCSSSPAFQTQRVRANTRRSGSRGAESAMDEIPAPAPQEKPASFRDQGETDQVPEKPPDRATRRKSSTEAPTTRHPDRVVAAEHASPTIMRPPSSKTGQTLRIAASTPKKRTLLCQAQISKQPSRVHSAKTDGAVDALLDATSQDNGPRKQKQQSQRTKLQERLARIRKKNAQDEDDLSADPASRTGGTLRKHFARAPVAATTTGLSLQTPLESNAFELAQLDQMIIPTEKPHEPKNMAAPAQAERQLRGVVSDSDQPASRPKRVPGAPVRYTPSPAKEAANVAPQLVSYGNGNAGSPTTPVAATAQIARGKKPIQRAVSLNTASSGTSTVMLSKPFQTPEPLGSKDPEPERAADPWSREAFDLFIWRPPGWDEEEWCLKDTVGGVAAKG